MRGPSGRSGSVRDVRAAAETPGAEPAVMEDSMIAPAEEPEELQRQKSSKPVVTGSGGSSPRTRTTPIGVVRVIVGLIEREEWGGLRCVRAQRTFVYNKGTSASPDQTGQGRIKSCRKCMLACLRLSGFGVAAGPPSVRGAFTCTKAL